MLDFLSRSAENFQTRPVKRWLIRSTPILVELGGGGSVVAVALGVLAHLVLTSRSSVFFYSGDSVLLPLIERSVREGQPWEWAMSSVLFFVPEIPVYLGIAALVPGVQADLVVNAVVIFVAFYTMIRLLASVVAPQINRPVKMAVALVPISVIAVCSLMEHSGQRASLELVSLFLTTTYYYGTTLAAVGSLPLSVTAVAGSTPDRRRRALGGLAVLSAAATFSNPLFVLWSVAPTVVAVGLLHLIRNRGERLVPRAAVTSLSAAALGGAMAGYACRIPMAKFISISIGHYFRIDRMAISLDYYVKDYFATAATWQGAVEMTLLAVAVSGTLALSVVVVVRRWPVRVALPILSAASSIGVTVVASVVLGTTASRYLMPLFFMPAAATVALLAYVVARIGTVRNLLPRRPSRRILQSIMALTGALATLGSVGAVHVIATAPSTQTYADATCLSNWVAGRDLTGAGRFWTIRALKTYGNTSVKLLQITGNYNATLWLDNASDYTGQQVSYLVEDSKSHYAVTPTQALGTPTQTVSCGQYTILDYRGTAGEGILTRRIAVSARQKIAQRHL